MYFEAAGSHASVESGMRALRKCGTMVTLGIMSSQQPHDLNVITAGKELNVVGSHSCSFDPGRGRGYLRFYFKLQRIILR